MKITHEGYTCSLLYILSLARFVHKQVILDKKKSHKVFINAFIKDVIAIAHHEITLGNNGTYFGNTNNVMYLSFRLGGKIYGTEL